MAHKHHLVKKWNDYRMILYYIKPNCAHFTYHCSKTECKSYMKLRILFISSSVIVLNFCLISLLYIATPIGLSITDDYGFSGRILSGTFHYTISQGDFLSLVFYISLNSAFFLLLFIYYTKKINIFI